MTFQHKNIRLTSDRYVGRAWFFITICSAKRRKLFTTTKTCDWLLHILRSDAAAHTFAVHAYCLMPDHVHLLLEGLYPTTDLLGFVKAVKTTPRQDCKIQN